MIKIWKEISISASHCLKELGEDHPCYNLHGHNYKIRVWLKQNTSDLLYDFGKVKEAMLWATKGWDHGHLNDILEDKTNCEYLAEKLYHLMAIRYPAVFQVDVQETDTCGASYIKDEDESELTKRIHD